jgi:CheY-like chemotaxis protein
MARVVVAHDDSEMQELLVELLTDLGHQVVGAANSSNAWHMLRMAPGGMVALLDMSMPRLHTLDALHKAVADPQITARHGIILLTTLPFAHSSLVSAKLLSELPPDIDVLAMPFGLEDLERAVESAEQHCLAQVRR